LLDILRQFHTEKSGSTFHPSPTAWCLCRHNHFSWFSALPLISQ